jgi:hypothetical protein
MAVNQRFVRPLSVVRPSKPVAIAAVLDEDIVFTDLQAQLLIWICGIDMVLGGAAAGGAAAGAPAGAGNCAAGGVA